MNMNVSLHFSFLTYLFSLHMCNGFVTVQQRLMMFCDLLSGWAEVVSVEKFADCALITTQDQLHKVYAYIILLSVCMCTFQFFCKCFTYYMQLYYY